MSNPIGYAFQRRNGPHRVLCLACCGGEVPSLALEDYDTDGDRARCGCRSEDERVIIWNKCGERLDGGILLPVKPDEIPVLRFALDHALSSIAEAHAQDRAAGSGREGSARVITYGRAVAWEAEAANR